MSELTTLRLSDRELDLFLAALQWWKKAQAAAPSAPFADEEIDRLTDRVLAAI